MTVVKASDLSPKMAINVCYERNLPHARRLKAHVVDVERMAATVEFDGTGERRKVHFKNIEIPPPDTQAEAVTPIKRTRATEPFVLPKPPAAQPMPSQPARALRHLADVPQQPPKGDDSVSAWLDLGSTLAVQLGEAVQRIKRKRDEIEDALVALDQRRDDLRRQLNDTDVELDAAQHQLQTVKEISERMGR